MGTVIELRTRRERRGADPHERLSAAVDRLDVAIEAAGSQPPPWLQTEVLAITGCISQGWIEEAAERAEALVARCERRWKRA